MKSAPLPRSGLVARTPLSDDPPPTSHWPRLALPAGGALDDAAWGRRHRAILILLWIHVPILLVAVVLAGAGSSPLVQPSGDRVLFDAVGITLVAALAALATWGRPGRRVREVAAALGLSTAAAVLVHVTGGATEAHFHFFILVAVVALYQDWPPLLAAVAFVLFEHGVVGALAPDVVFDGPAVHQHAWVWASLHAGAVLGVAAACVAAWSITEAEHAARLAERDRAEAALRAREAEFRSLLENAPDVVAVLDRSGVVRFVTPAIRTVLGYDPDTFVGDLQFGNVHPDDASIMWTAFARLEHRPSAREECTIRIRHADGSWRWIEAIAQNRLDDPVVAGIVANFRDVTEQIRARDELAAQNERLAKVVATEAALVDAELDEQEVLALVADRMADVVGAAGASVDLIEGDSLVIRAASGLAAPHVGTRLPLDGSLAGECARTGTVQRSGDAPNDPRVHHDSAILFGSRSLLAVPLRHRQDIVGVLKLYDREPGAFADGDDAYLQIMGGFIGAALANASAYEAARAAREAAEQADALKTNFLLTMSHELRTPLTAITGYADILLEGMSGDLTPTQAEDVGSIASGANRLLRLVDDLLDLATINAGRIDLRLAPVNVATILAEVREDVAPQAAAKGITLTFDVAPDVPTVLADGDRLRQAVLNLVGNAVKFTDRGSVTVAATADARGVAVTVRDTGIGIAPDDLPRLFDGFWQADGSPTRRHGGAGLGLAIARRLVEAHGGTISVASTPDTGSTFTARIPISLASPAPEAARPSLMDG